MVTGSGQGTADRTKLLEAIVKTLQPLVSGEESRSSNFNTRAAAVLSASSIVTAISGFFAKDLYTESDRYTSTSEWLIVIGFVPALVALGVTVGFCLGVLLPKTRYFYSPAHVRVWAGSPAQDTPAGTELPPAGELPDSEDAVFERSIHELGWIYDKLQSVNDVKAWRLERAYISLGIAVALVVVVAIALGIYSLVIEPPATGQ